MTCDACAHPDRDDLDVRLAQFDSLTALSAMFGVSQVVLKRHKESHLRRVAVRMSNDPASVLTDLQAAEEEARTVMVLAKGIKAEGETEYLVKPQPKLLLEAIDRIVTIKNTQVKLAKELAMFKKDMVSREVFNRMTAAVLKALENYPDALAAVQDALAELPE